MTDCKSETSETSWLDNLHYPKAERYKDIGFLKGGRMVRWQMGNVDELQNLEAKLTLWSKKNVQN